MISTLPQRARPPPANKKCDRESPTAGRTRHSPSLFHGADKMSDSDIARPGPTPQRVAVNSKPLGEYHPLQEWPRAELSVAARWLRSIAKMHDADAAAAP
jgi:hypothetical protein